MIPNVLQEPVQGDERSRPADSSTEKEVPVSRHLQTALLHCWKRTGVAQRLKHLPAMQETRVRSLGQEDPGAKEMATHSSILAWRIPWTEEPGGL